MSAGRSSARSARPGSRGAGRRPGGGPQRAARPASPEEIPKSARDACRGRKGALRDSECRTATGRVLYVEAVDPDGDGDAHFVLAGGRITAPGISAIAVRRELRPRRLPEIGDWVSAAGVVWTGSHGQQQIEAEVLHVARR